MELLMLLFKSLLVTRTKAIDSTLLPMERELQSINAVLNVENVFKQVEHSAV